MLPQGSALWFNHLLKLTSGTLAGAGESGDIIKPKIIFLILVLIYFLLLLTYPPIPIPTPIDNKNGGVSLCLNNLFSNSLVIDTIFDIPI